jgi:two-component system, sensor histidine kinase and response regulator
MMAKNMKKIIVVDDNLEYLITIKNVLKASYDVYPTDSVSNMFDLLNRFLPDLILLDVAMQDVNGYEAARTLKNDDRFKAIPIIFLTSMDDPENEMEGLNLGAIDYIHKPFIAQLLVRRIMTHLSFMEQQKIILEHNKKIEELLEQKTKDVSLREAAELEALNASRAKGEFLSHMSHEIRSPLNAVIGMISMAAETDDVQKIRDYLKKAYSAGRHVLGLINDILDMSKIEANKLELSHSEFNFMEMLTGIVNEAGVRASEKHQNITVNVNLNIPPVITCDELRLSQIITNLLTNAIKFTPDNGHIEVNAEKLNEKDGEITLRIAVADSGIGISPEQQLKLFTSYNQADSGIAQKFGGTGLGLAISKRIIELMRGRIWIESELGKGAKFIFTIKTGKGTDKASEGASRQGGVGGSGFDFSNYSILVAEDDAINREIMSAILGKTGISVDFAENGKRAVSMFQEHPERYDMILMDVHMPEMNGYEATRAIRASGMEIAKNIRIIALTADVFKEDIEKCLEAGMDDHIGKPIFPNDLYAMLKKNLMSANN